MATRKINFERFKEGDVFSGTNIDTRFSSLEDDLNSDQTGLHPSLFSGGALNHQHLDFSGNAGSHLIAAHTVRDPPTKERHSYAVYTMSGDRLLEGLGGVGWSQYKGTDLWSAATEATRGTFTPVHQRIDGLSFKVGRYFRRTKDEAYCRAVLILFDTYVWKAPRNGLGFELMVQTSLTGSTDSDWKPLYGSDRWVMDNTDSSDQYESNSYAAQWGSTVNIRFLLDFDRLKEIVLSGMSATDAATAEITAVKVRMAAIDSIPGALGAGDDEVHLGHSMLTVMGFRGHMDSIL